MRSVDLSCKFEYFWKKKLAKKKFCSKMFEHFWKKRNLNFSFGGGLGPPPKNIQGLDIFFRIGGPLLMVDRRVRRRQLHLNSCAGGWCALRWLWRPMQKRQTFLQVLQEKPPSSGATFWFCCWCRFYLRRKLHVFVSLQFAFFGFFLIFCAPATAICCICLEHVRRYLELF